MSRRLTATETKAKLLSLLEEVAKGEEIEITKHGRTVARLVPGPGRKLAMGEFKGVAWTTDPNDELLTATEESDWEFD
jgi:prevent-host-death family protein